MSKIKTIKINYWRNIMEIKNKLESVAKINELRLNRFPEAIFRRNETEKVRQFFKKTPLNITP